MAPPEEAALGLKVRSDVRTLGAAEVDTSAT
jgi:hypothetical protein